MFANRQGNSDTSGEFRGKSTRLQPVANTGTAIVQAQSSRAPEVKIVHPNQPSQRSQ